MPRVVFLAALVLGLAACEEPEFILPGEREDIRDISLLRDVQRDDIEGSRPISLPAQSNNAAWAQGAGTPSMRPAHPALSGNPQLAWSVDIGEGDSRKQRITADPVVGGGRIYTLDSGAQVTALAPSGAVLWSRDLTPARANAGEATGGGMSYDNGTLYVSLGFGTVSALEAETGAVRWTQNLEAAGSGRPTIAGNLLYLVAGAETGWALDTRDGRIVWQVAGTPTTATVLGSPAPVIDGSLVIFAFGSGDLVATFRQGGLRRWSASVAGGRLGSATARIGDITGAPVIQGGTLFAGNHAGRLAAFEAANGERLWTAPEGAFNPVWPAGDSIFAVTDRNQLVRIDSGDGALIWAVDLPGFVADKPKRRAEVYAHHGPVLAGGRLLVASNDGVLRSFSPIDGSLVGTNEIPDGATSAPVVAGGTLYIASTNGQLHAFR